MSTGDVASFCTGMPSRRRALASSSRPFSIASSRRSRENHWRILLRARGEATNSSQSRDGPLATLEVTISTVSPDVNRSSRRAMLPLMRAPMQWWPTSVWMA
jgi:hypothetical protein